MLEVVGITVPTGYSFNLDGTAIYLTMASLFIATGMGRPMSIGEQKGADEQEVREAALTEMAAKEERARVRAEGA